MVWSHWQIAPERTGVGCQRVSEQPALKQRSGLPVIPILSTLKVGAAALHSFRRRLVEQTRSRFHSAPWAAVGPPAPLRWVWGLNVSLRQRVAPPNALEW